MSESRIFHIGIVVAELAPAMRELSAATGVTWGRRQDAEVTFDTPDGPRVWPVGFAYSTRAPYLELIEQRAGTVWAERGFHHLGLWSDDVHADSAALEADGGAWQAAMTDDRGRRVGGCYHLLTAADCRVELVSRELATPRLERYLAGGDYL